MKINQILESTHSTNEFNKNFPDTILYRGAKNLETGFQPFKFRSIPTDTFLPFHNSVNEISQQRIGLPIRNLMFSSRNENVAMEYGNMYKIIPCDGYKIFYSTTFNDMTEDLKVSRMSIDHAMYNIFSHNPGTKLEPEESSRFLNQFSKFILETKNNNLDNCSGVFMEFFKSIIDPKKVEANEKDIIKYFSDTKHKAVEYVSSISEAKSSSDIADISNYREIMIYAPDGFKVEFIRKSVYED